MTLKQEKPEDVRGGKTQISELNVLISVSYDYDGSVSGLSEDDQAYDVPKNLFRKEKGRISASNSRGIQFIVLVQYVVHRYDRRISWDRLNWEKLS